jgi:hypothetical protein
LRNTSVFRTTRGVRGAVVCSSERERHRETQRGSEVVISSSWFEDDSRAGEELFRRPSGVSEYLVAMKRVFGAKKDKTPAPTVEEATERMNKRGDTVDEKIKKLDAELFKYKEQIKRTRPGPAQEAVKARAMRLLKQKKMYEGQRDQLYSQTFNLEQVAFATEGIKDAQQTVRIYYPPLLF